MAWATGGWGVGAPFGAGGVLILGSFVVRVMNQADEASLFGLLHEETGMGHQFELQGGFYYRLASPPPE